MSSSLGKNGFTQLSPNALINCGTALIPAFLTPVALSERYIKNKGSIFFI